MKFKKAHPTFSLLLGVVFLACGCNRPTEFSAVIRGDFNPVAAFSQHGYRVLSESSGQGVSNAENGYAWVSWCGVLAPPPERGNSSAAAVALRDELHRVWGRPAYDELTDVRALDGEPIRGMLIYNGDTVRGQMHVWLTPCASNTEIAYVIFAREERSK